LNQTVHTSKRYDAELEAVRASVLQMGGLVEQQIVQALQALSNGDVRLADRVVDQDCSQIIARRQPAAGDLRMVMTVIKTITDLERIGDEADKIARMAKLIHTSDRLYAPRLADIKHVADLALDMLRKALDAFARLDTAAAVEVLRQDVQVRLAGNPVRRQGGGAYRRPCQEHGGIRRLHGQGQGRAPHHRGRSGARSVEVASYGAMRSELRRTPGLEHVSGIITAA
jgi:phosphate transport system protein